MSRVYFISDLHLGHHNILGFCRPQFATVEEMHEYIVDTWNDTVNKRDCVYVLGDVWFGADHQYILNRLQGNKKLVLGNHDRHSMSEYAQYFSKIFGMTFYKEAVLSHMPCHPNNLEFRAKINIHGHIHDPKDNIQDARYINVCMDCVPFMRPISWEEIYQQANNDR